MTIPRLGLGMDGLRLERGLAALGAAVRMKGDLDLVRLGLTGYPEGYVSSDLRKHHAWGSGLTIVTLLLLANCSGV